MGGIAGWMALDRPGPPDLGRRMADRMAQRGQGRLAGRVVPEKAELWQAGGHLAAAEADENDGPHVVLDGDIYNLDEVLDALGLSPLAGPEEAVRALIRTRGPESLAALNGDFAGAYYDSADHELILFRDRFGVRPLVFTRTGGLFLFASDVNSLKAMDGWAARPHPHTLFDYLATHYRYIHRDPVRSFYENVYQAPPAGILHVRPEGLRSYSYWNLTLDPDVDRIDPEQAARELKDRFEQAVRIRLIPDQAAGFGVSSGMDSSSVAAAAARIAGRPPELYSVTYGFSEYDETAGIEPLVRHLGSRWHNVVAAQPPLFDLIGRIITQTGQPLVTVTWLSHYLLAQQAAGDGAQVLFSGLGGDENLAGEYEHFLYFFADLKQAGQTERLAEEVAAWIRLHDHPIFRKNWMVVQDVFDRLVDLDAPGRVRLDERRYRANWAWFNDDFLASGPQTALPVNPFSSYLTNRCYQDLVFETTPPCLAADNANAAQFGLVTRFPFLDPHLVRFCYSLPGTLKYNQGVTKAVMRRAMAGMLPEENIRNTTKTGFNAPAGDWLAGPARADLMDLFGSRSFKERGWLKPGSADRLVRQHLSGQANHMMLLWQLINAELWLRSLAENGGTASR